VKTNTPKTDVKEFSALKIFLVQNLVCISLPDQIKTTATPTEHGFYGSLIALTLIERLSITSASLFSRQLAAP
jgi:hypothetical protein